MHRRHRLLLVACLVGLSTSVRPEEEAWAREIDSLVRSLVSGVAATPERARARIDVLIGTVGQPALDRLEAAIRKAGGGGQFEEIVRQHGVSVIRWAVQTGRSTWPPLLTANDRHIACASDGGLHLIEAETGILLWRKQGNFERPVPGFFANLVIAHRPPDSVAAYRVRTGKLVWAHSLADVGGDTGSTRHILRLEDGKAQRVRVALPPAALTDTALRTTLATGARRLVCATRTGHVVCVSAEGERLWAAPPPNAASGPARIACDDTADRVVVTYPRSDALVARSLADGKHCWEAAVDGLRALDPVTSAGRVLVAAAPILDGRLDGRVECLDVATGKRLWQCRTKAPARGAGIRRAHHGGLVAESGLIDRPGAETTVVRMCLAAGGALFVAETRTARFCMRVADGAVQWTVPLAEDGATFGGPERDGRLFGFSDGTLLLMDATTGTVERKIELAGLGGTGVLDALLIEKEGRKAVLSLGRLGRPVVIERRCHLSTEAGGVLCLDIPALTARREKP